MYRVAAAINFRVGPATWAAALVVVAGWIAGALFIANHLASTPQPAPRQKAMAVSEPSQTPNRAAKTAREPFKQAGLAPDPSVLSAPLQALENKVSLPHSAQDPATSRDTSQDDAAEAQGQTGRASWYDLEAKTASGEAMGEALTAAHPSLPFGSKVRVVNLDNGRSVVVRINDRGPFSGGRIIDVSRAADEQLGMIGSGVARVSVNPVDNDVVSASAGALPLQP